MTSRSATSSYRRMEGKHLAYLQLIFMGLRLPVHAQKYDWIGEVNTRSQYDNGSRGVILPDPSDTIAIQGVVVAWRARFGGTRPNAKVRLQIWRPIVSRESFLARLVGESDYRSLAVFGRGVHVFNLESHEQIRTEDDDIIGLQYESGNPIPHDAFDECAAGSSRRSGGTRRMDIRNSLDYILHEDSDPFRTFSTLSTGCRIYSLAVRLRVSDCSTFIAESTETVLSTYEDPSTNDIDACWAIRSANPDLAPVVTVQRIQVNSTSCEAKQHFLDVRQGSTSSGRLLNRYCATTVEQAREPDTFEGDPGGALYIRFVSSGGVGGFRLTYRTSWRPLLPGENLVCPSIVVGATAYELKSPNYPNNYPADTDICWNLRAAKSRSRIRVEVKDSQMEMWTEDTETGKSICQDAIRLYNGGNIQAPLLREWCGNERPQDLLSDGPELLVWFATNGDTEERGFFLNVYFENQEPLNCNEINVTDVEQYIESRGYPYQYPVRWEACWVLTAEANRGVRLAIHDSRIESSSFCSYDYLEVRDGGHSRSPLMRRTCSQETGSHIISSSNRMYVYFLSDGSIQGIGFRLGYSSANQEACATYSAFPFLMEVTSPGYSERATYPRNTEVCWTIEAPSSGGQVKLVLQDFSLQGSQGCIKDAVYFYDGGSVLSPSIGQWCGNHSDGGLLSSGRQLTLRFVSDDNVESRGFSFFYHTQPMHECDYLYAATTESWLTSPNYPLDYSPNLVLCWIIEAPTGREVIQIDVFNISLDGPRVPNSRCDQDWLSIRDGNSRDANEVAILCGSDLPTVTTVTSTNFARITFVTNTEGHSSGFRLRFISRVESRCAAVDVGPPVGFLSSTGYPVTYLPYSFDCWTLMASSNSSIIRLLVEDFDVAENCRDYVDITEGTRSDGFRLRRWCGGKTPGDVASFGPVLSVRFVTDGVRLGRGFKISYWEEPMVTADTPTTERATPTTAADVTSSTEYIPSTTLSSTAVIPAVSSPSSTPQETTTSSTPGTSSTSDTTPTSSRISPPSSSSSSSSFSSSSPTVIQNVGTSRSSLPSSSTGRTESSQGSSLETSTKAQVTTQSTSPKKVTTETTTKELDVIIPCTRRTVTQTQSSLLSSRAFQAGLPGREDLCWILTTDDESDMTFQIIGFVIGTSNVCLEEYLEIRSGDSSSSPLVVRYCGRSSDAASRTYVTDGPSVYFRFVTKSRYSYFILRYEKYVPAALPKTTPVIIELAPQELGKGDFWSEAGLPIGLVLAVIVVLLVGIFVLFLRRRKGMMHDYSERPISVSEFNAAFLDAPPAEERCRGVPNHFDLTASDLDITAYGANRMDHDFDMSVFGQRSIGNRRKTSRSNSGTSSKGKGNGSSSGSTNGSLERQLSNGSFGSRGSLKRQLSRSSSASSKSSLKRQLSGGSGTNGSGHQVRSVTPPPLKFTDIMDASRDMEESLEDVFIIPNEGRSSAPRPDELVTPKPTPHQPPPPHPIPRRSSQMRRPLPTLTEHASERLSDTLPAPEQFANELPEPLVTSTSTVGSQENRAWGEVDVENPGLTASQFF